MHANPPEERASFQKYALAGFGLLAAGVLVAVSAAMNYKFGYQLGKTEADGQIYGAASIAADAFKCLSPFFFFAAVRNRMWSQAMAAAIVWLVTTGYALTGAIGHASLNRHDTMAKREAVSDTYKDLKKEQGRIEQQIAWIPQHRPASTVAAEIEAKKTDRIFRITAGCTSVNSGVARSYCADLHRLEAEHGSALEGAKLQSRLDEIASKLAPIGTASTVADPQAATFARLSGIDMVMVQSLLALLVVVLIEVGSGLGPYVAMSYFPDKPRSKRRMETPTPANDDMETAAETTVVQFPRATTAVSASDAAVSASAALGSAVMSAGQDGREFSEDEAKEDLIVLIARDGKVPNQQILADRWGVAKSTVSKWLDRWEEFERVGGAKPYQAKAIVRKGALEAAA